LLAFAKAHGITLQAWGALGAGVWGPSILKHPALVAAAAAHNVTTAQVALRWSVQQGVVVIAGTANEAHTAADLDLWGFELSEAEMKAISAVGEGGRAHLHATVEPPSSWFKAQELHLVVGGHHHADHMLRAPVLVVLLCLLLLKCVSSYDKVAVSPYDKVAVVAPAPEKVAAMAPVPAPRRNLAGAGAPVGPRRGRRINNFNPDKYKLSLCHRWHQPIHDDGKLIWSLGEHPPTPTRRQSKATLV